MNQMRAGKTGWSMVVCGLLAAATFAQSEAASPPPQVGISPTRFEVPVGSSPTTNSFRVTNLGEDPLEIRVSIANWEMDEENHVRIIAPTPQSLDQWIVVNPVHFTVPPRESQVVRFSIRPRVEPEPGEHRAMIYLDQVLDEAPAGSGLRIKFQYGVTVYGYVGEPDRQGTVETSVDAGTEAVEARFDIRSTGSAYVRLGGTWAVWSAADYQGASATAPVKGDAAGSTRGLLTTGNLPALPVLGGTTRTQRFALHGLPAGDYVLDVNGELSGTPIDEGIPFSVP